MKTVGARFPVVLALVCSVGLFSHVAAAATWDPTSTPKAPCGVGTPPPGHEIREFTSTDRVKRLAIEVKQGVDRLCYVSDGIADAPVIRVRQGDTLSVTLSNEITDADAISRFVPEAQLDAPRSPIPARAGFIPVVAGMSHAATGITNLHMHGFPVPPVPPQDEVLATCADPAMPRITCQRHTISYVYQIPPNMPTGLYWYHPHFHGETEAQVEMGLYGAVVVEGPDDDARKAMGIHDRIIVIGQTRIAPPPTPIAQVVPQNPDQLTDDDDEENAAPPPPKPTGPPRTWPERIDTEHEVGCAPPQPDGILTLNGTPVPEGAPGDASLAHYVLPPMKKELWRIVNATADEYLDLAVVDDDGTNLPIAIVARDGAPLADDAGVELPPQRTADAQLLPPAGRIEFLVSPPPIGHTAHLVSHAVDTGCAGNLMPERTLAVLTADRTKWPPVADPPAPPPVADPPSIFAGILGQRTTKERTIALTEYPRPGSDDEVDYAITELKPGAQIAPFHMGGPPLITTRAGTTEEWVIENWTHELHAFHIHQVHFRVLAVNDQPLPDPPLVDVVNVPYATPNDSHAPNDTLLPGRVRIKVYFPESLAGDIPFHCHILDHEDNGMMAVIRVLPAAQWWRILLPQPSTPPPQQHAELSPEDVALNPPICRPVVR